MKRTFLPLAAALVVGSGLIAAGCGDDDSDQAASTPATTSTMEQHSGGTQEASVETGASELRAGLTGLLTDHVYQAVLAIDTGLGAGLDSKEFEAAAATLDNNSVALSKAVGGVYGDDAGKQFLALWRDHIGFFVDYTKAKAGKDAAGAKAAREKLDGYRTEFGAFIEGANPNLPADAVAAELEPHVDSLIAVIDSAIAKEPDVFDKVKEAASHMPMTAKTLAVGIASQKPQDFDGSAEAGAAELRSGLTGLLGDHVYLASIAVAKGLGNGLDSKQFKAAAGALDANSEDLAGAIESVYGAEAGAQFLALWRAHIGMFVDYTKGVATKDKVLKEKALSELDGYRTEFGAFLESANPNLPADAVAAELEPHVGSLTAAIRAAAARSPKVFDRIAEAASHMPMTAKTLAGGIVKQMPDKFPST